MIYDAISTPESQVTCWSILAPKGTLIITKPPSSEIGDPGPDGEKVNEKGKKVALVNGTVSNDVTGDVRLGERMFGVLEAMLSEGSLRPNTVEVLEGGLAGIDSEKGLKRLGEGKVSGVKLVVRVEETPGI